MRIQKIIGRILLLPFVLAMFPVTVIGALFYAIIGSPLFLALSLLDGEFPKSFVEFYKDCLFGFSIFPIKLLLFGDI